MNKYLQPPDWVDKFIDRLAPPALAEEIRGDLYELYQLDLERTPRSAKRKYVTNAFGFLFKRFFWNSTNLTSSTSFSMLNNYFLIAWRSLVKNKTFYLINIFGLSVGLACALLIGSYIHSELTYDTYAEHSDDIYRVEIRVLGNGNWMEYATVDFGVGSGIAEAYPEVVSFTRLSHWYTPYLRYNDIVLKAESIAVADSNFLDFFSIPLLSGNSKLALSEPNQLVISRDFARRYFGSEDPMGKVLLAGETGYKITGVFDRIPENSHFKFDAFLSGETFMKFRRPSWSNVGETTYIQLAANADAKALEQKFPDLVRKHVVPEVQADMGVGREEAEKAVNTFIFTLRPLRDIHLGSHTADELTPAGDIRYVYIFGALAVFILLLACVNFINLSTATSARRTREIGIRKVMGSIRQQLITQFLTESVLLALCAMVLAYVLVAGLLPMFNQLTGKTTTFSYFLQPMNAAWVVGGTLVVGILSGAYPSFLLSSFNTVQVLKGSATGTAGRKDFLRSSLVVFQFAVSSALIAATLIVYQQLSYMQNKNLGYSKEQVLVINETRALRENEKNFRNDLANDSRVINASVSSHMPGERNMQGTQAYAKDRVGDGQSTEIHIDIFRIDYDYLNTLAIELAYGRNFSRDFPSDSAAVVINEAAAYEFGWTPETAVDKKIITSGQWEYRVVGVVKNFNYTSPRQKVGPLVMMLRGNRGAVLVKLNASDIGDFIENARTLWDKYNMNGDIPFSYTFLDEKFKALYTAEERTGKIFTSFATLAVIIAGLGLFGLSTYSAEQRTREIGIRKVLGASSRTVLLMLSRQFMLLVLLAFAIAVPLVLWSMNQWLSDFAYRVSIGWWIFVIAAGISCLIAFASMGIQAAKAATANPVKSLRN